MTEAGENDAHSQARGKGSSDSYYVHRQPHVETPQTRTYRGFFEGPMRRPRAHMIQKHV